MLIHGSLIHNRCLKATHMSSQHKNGYTNMKYIHTLAYYSVINGMTSDAHKNMTESQKYKVGWKKPDTTQYILYNSITFKNRPNSSVVLGCGRQRWMGDWLEGGPRDVLDLALGGSYMGVHVCNNLSSCTFKTCVFYCMFIQCKSTHYIWSGGKEESNTPSCCIYQVLPFLAFMRKWFSLRLQSYQVAAAHNFDPASQSLTR